MEERFAGHVGTIFVVAEYTTLYSNIVDIYIGIGGGRGVEARGRRAAGN